MRGNLFRDTIKLVQHWGKWKNICDLKIILGSYKKDLFFQSSEDEKPKKKKRKKDTSEKEYDPLEVLRNELKNKDVKSPEPRSRARANSPR